MKCKDVMLTLVFKCTETTTAADCAKVMRDEQLGFVPVMNDAGAVVGVVTDRDLAIRVLAGRRDFRTAVGAVMSPGPFLTCKADDDLEVLEQHMAETKKGRALVTDATGAVVGIISLSDIAQREPSDTKTGRLLRAVTRRESVSLSRL